MHQFYLLAEQEWSLLTAPWRHGDINHHTSQTDSRIWPMFYFVVVLILSKRPYPPKKTLGRTSLEPRRDGFFTFKSCLQCHTSIGFYCYKASDVLCSTRKIGMGIVWHHYIWLFLSWVKDVMISQPVVGPDVIIPKPSLRYCESLIWHSDWPQSYKSTCGKYFHHSLWGDLFFKSHVSVGLPFVWDVSNRVGKTNFLPF